MFLFYNIKFSIKKGKKIERRRNAVLAKITRFL